MNRTLSTVLFVLLLCASGYADVTSVSNTVSLVHTEGAEGYLHAPRYQIACGTEAGRLMMITYDNANRFIFSSDSGLTWSEVPYTVPYPTLGTDHDHVQYANDTAYVVARRISSDSAITYQMVDITDGTILLDSTIGLQVDCGYNNAVGTMIPFGDLIIGGSRGYACSFEGIISTKDHSDVTYTQIADYSTYTTSTRFGGGHAFGDSTVWIGGFIDNGSGENDSVIVWLFDPSDSTWTETNPFSGVDLDRFFTVNTFHDTAMMVAGWLDNSSKLVTAYRGIGTANTWTYDTVISTTAQDRPNAALTYIESTSRLVMWTHYDGDLRIHAFNDDFTWSPAFDVIIDSTCEVVDLAIPEVIPSSHGSVAYAGVKVGGNTLIATTELTEEGNWITSLPYTCNTRGETYLFPYDLDWPGNPGNAAITVSADSITIDMRGYELSFGSNDSGGITGIDASGVDTFYLRNGRVRHNPTDSTIDLCLTEALDISNATYVTVEYCSLSVTGVVPYSSYYISAPYSSQEVVPFNAYSGINTVDGHGGSSYAHHFRHCVIENNVTGFFRRGTKYVAALQYGYGIPNPPDSNGWNLRLDSNKIYSSFLGVRFGYHSSFNRGIMRSRGNTFVGRVRQDLTPWSSADGGYRYGDCYQVELSWAEGVRMAHDTITYDTSAPYHGGLGIFINNTGPEVFTGFKNIFDSLYVISAAGPQGNESNSDRGHNTCVRMRNDNKYVLFRGGYYEAQGDTISTDSTNSTENNVFWLGYNESWGTDTLILDGVTIVSNDSSGIGGVEHNAIRFATKDPADYWVVRNCSLRTDGAFVRLVDNDANQQVDSVLMVNDTFTLGDHHDGSALAVMESNYQATANRILNPTYQNSATFGYTTGTASTQDLTEQVEMVLTVKDDGGNIIEGANVWAVNSISPDTLFKKTTNASGQVTDTVNTNFISRTAVDTTLAQYNDFTVGAAYLGDTGEVTFTLTMDVNDTLIQLGDIPINQTNVVVDTNNLSAYIQTTFTAIDSGVRWYKLLWGTANPPTAKYGDSIESPTNPDTFVVMPTIPNTKYYFMTVVQDSATLDTSSLDSITTLKTPSHSVTAFDVNDVDFRVEDDYVANTVDSIWIVWDDDSDMADSLGRFVITAGITDPDTLVASGLSQATTYYYRVRFSDQLGISSSTVGNVTTLSPGEDRPVVLSDGIKLSGKVIIQ